VPLHRRRNNGASAVLALLAGLAAAALLHGRGIPPLYDGIATPPEPYRWVSPPADVASSNQSPLSASATFNVVNGQFQGGLMYSRDNQVVVTFGSGSVQPVVGSTSVACTIEPLARPPSPPAGAEIRGNVYHLACVGLPGSTVVAVPDHFVVRLRYPPGPFDEIQFYDGQRWQRLATTNDPGGNPWARASVRAFGDTAATARPSGIWASILAALRQRPEVGALLALVIVFGVTALVLEIRRRRKQGR
jgi:hypothetical protein